VAGPAVVPVLDNPLDAYVKGGSGWLEFHMFSRGLPPMISIRGSRSGPIMGVLCREFGCTSEDGSEVAVVRHLYAFPVLVWLAASASAPRPSQELLRALIRRTPRSAIDILLELADAEAAYRRRRPLIPPGKLYAASKVIRGLLKLHGYPVEV